eukprot:gene517-1166_t
MSAVISRAVIFKRGGDSLVNKRDQYELINDFQCPQLGTEDCLIKIEACALPKGDYQLFDSLGISSGSYVPVGREMSGKCFMHRNPEHFVYKDRDDKDKNGDTFAVTLIGKSVTRFKVDDEVTGVIPLDVNCAGCGSLCVLSQYDIVHKPASVSHVDACAMIGDGIKAYTALYYLAKVSSGDCILICNGASGFGLTAIQLAQHIGAKVIATSSSDEELHFLKSQQPPIARIIDIRMKKQSLVSACLEETSGLGVDCIIDNGVEMYNSSTSDDNLICFDDSEKDCIPHKHDLISALAVSGKWITRQRNLQLDPPDSELLFLKCASVSFLFAESWTLSRSKHNPPSCNTSDRYLFDQAVSSLVKEDILEDVMDRLSKGVLRPVVHHSVQLEDCLEELGKIGENKVGRVVVRTS